MKTALHRGGPETLAAMPYLMPVTLSAHLFLAPYLIMAIAFLVALRFHPHSTGRRLMMAASSRPRLFLVALVSLSILEEL